MPQANAPTLPGTKGFTVFAEEPLDPLQRDRLFTRIAGVDCVDEQIGVEKKTALSISAHFVLRGWSDGPRFQAVIKEASSPG